MDTIPGVAAPDVATGYVVVAAAATSPSWHDIPHPIGDPDDDEGLPVDDDDDDDEDDEDDEDPLQVRLAVPLSFLHRSTAAIFLV
jgi:hypothetical protein